MSDELAKAIELLYKYGQLTNAPASYFQAVKHYEVAAKK